MRVVLYTLLLVGVLSRRYLAQNCPLLGPAYPAPTDIVSSALTAAKVKFEEALRSDPRIDRKQISFAVQVYSSSSKTPIHSHYNTAPLLNSSTVGPETLFRIHSISKVLTVYTIISKLGHMYWHEPVAKYVPELAVSRQGDDIRSTDWSEVTLGDLASQMSGISRDYALGDASTAFQQIPGARPLQSSEVVRCGSGGLNPCSRAEAIRYILATHPVSAASTTPNYSNMAFQILSYGIESMTGESFPDLVTSQLIKPLNLKRTFLTNPGNDTNAVIYDGWDLDFGDEAPTGGYYQSISDLTTIGQSILNSTLMPPLATRKWLKPVSHTSSLLFSIGRPWEILRQDIPVSTSPGTTTTRTVDLYTKQGGGDTYTSLIGLSPDHGMGISITTAGPSSFSAGMEIRQLFIDLWLPAAEQAARDQASQNFVGTYTVADNSSIEIKLDPNQPALFLLNVISNGTDMFPLIEQLQNRQGPLGMWLYPMGLVAENRVAFRGVTGVGGRPAAKDCGSWAEGDRMRWGNYPVDLVIFEMGKDGKAVTVEVPALGRTLEKVR